LKKEIKNNEMLIKGLIKGLKLDDKEEESETFQI